jgi:amino acid adenylation domain-containing protein
MDSLSATPPAAGTPPQAPGSSRKRLDLLLRLARENDSGTDRIRPRAEGPAPLSFGQERLWLLNQLDSSVAAYNVTTALRLGRLDAAALERALGSLVRRHETLRTTFAESGGAAVQVVAPLAGFTLPVEDLSALEPAAREAAVLRRAAEECAEPCDLSAGPLFRPRLLRAGEDDVLLVNLHHAVCDGWSMGVLFRDLAALYAAEVEGREAALPALEVQYGDYAVWQRARLSGAALEGQLAYWRGRLAGAPALLELPADHPRPAVQSYRGAMATFEVPAAVADRLRALARAEDATLFMVLLAAFQVLLGRYAGTDDVVMGTPVSGRGQRETEGLIGFFVNTLVLRTDLGGDPAFRETLRRVRATTLGAFEHAETPFESLVAELRPERSLSHAPLVQVMFTTEPAPPVGGAGAGLPVRGVAVERHTAQFDLALGIAESAGGGLRGSLIYATDLFEGETAARMLRHLVRVLEQAAANPDVRLSRIGLVDADERRLVVEAWNRTDRDFPRDVCIHERFEAQVRARPDAPALLWEGLALSYAELDARANRLAHHLRRHGVGPDARVGVMLERGAELIVSLLAILKAGGCYVPLDPGYPPERLRLMLADSAGRVLLTRTEHAGMMDADAGIPVVSLDGDADAIAAESAEPVRSGATAENLAYIVYTSGSTGRPKGVMVAHRHVIQLVVGTDYVQLAPGDRVAQASNASFDALAFEAWGALLNGATLVGIPRDVLLSPPALRDLLRAERITTLYQTTALLNQLSGEQPDVFATVREVLFGGQAVDAASVRRVLEHGRPGRLLHMYGPTETTAWSSYETVEQVAENALTVSVGRPTGNQRVYVLDSVLAPAPLGVPGEAYVGGAGVVRGYLDRPALTAKRFVPDPFAGEPGARMYRTGDRLRWKADGRLEFVGRLDAQVKVRGFRIEPGEIESALGAHPDVREARVVVREDAPGEQRLVAYVVGGAGEADGDALRAHLRRTLPEYMVPGAFVALDRLPLTPNGKLDVRALPAPEMASGEDRYVAPRTPAEAVLATIWAEVLRVDRVGAADDFFALGGHSLLATRVVSRIREVFAAELPLRALFEAPTLAGLAERVEQIRRAGLPILPPVVPVDRAEPLPLSFAQERLWFLDRLQPGGAFYNTPSALRLGGALDVPALERALGETVRRHETLRTVFAEDGGAPVQVILPFAGFTLPVEDLGGMDEAEREAAVLRRAREEAARPFDLAAGPLFRAVLLRLADDEHVLLLGMHHVVTDGWSQGILVRDLSELYAAFAEGRDPVLPALPVQYADYAVWQRRQLQGAALEGQLAYWRARLADAPALLELPTDHPRPAVQGSRGARAPVALPRALLDGLQALGRREGATLYMTLLAAFQVLLGKYAGTADVVVGTPVAGRARRETEELVGFFVNSLVLRTDLGGDPAFREVLRRVRDVTLGAWEHQDVPFERLVEELQPERSLSHSPLFQVVFTLQNADGGAGGTATGLRVRGVESGSDTTRYDLTLDLTAHAGGVGGALEYRTDLFRPATTERMARHLERILAQAAEDADARLSALRLMDGDERSRVTEEWNRTDRDFPRDVCLHERFAEQVRARPDAPALAWDDLHLSYAELDARANRLAHALRRRGVGPDVRVGVLLERGAELIVSILAVLKAGGCYVPLDPGYPPERLRLMLADSAARVLVTRTEHAGVVDADGLAVLALDADADAIAAESAEAVQGGAAPENLAYVVYTSGSTGRPKGVMVSHRNVVQLVVGTDYVQLAPGDRVAQASNASFDALAFETWGALLNGATLVGIPRDVLLSSALHGFVRAEGITTLYQTTALLNLLSREQPDLFAPLREVLFGGQAVDADSVRRILRNGRPRRLLHMYGPTETTAWCSYETVEDVAEDALTVSVGRPTGNQRIYVLDGALGPTPAGIPGEAYVGGAGIVRGYLDRPALTAERFVPDPFAAEPGARMYRTGDRLRWTAEGTLEFLGRLDAQVKIRGFRIEPGEIESALTAHGDVREARVVVREDAPGEPRLVAYVVGAVDGESLRAHLRRGLPEYMLPAAFVTVDRLPLTPSGKLDVRALPAPALEGGEARYVAPRTPVEEVLAETWAGVLHVDRVGVHDGFFELGGHSLLATRLVSRIREAFGVELPLRALFEGPTVAQLAERVEAIRRAGVPVLPPVVPVERTGPLPLSFAQERLWFLDRLQPGDTAYNVPAALRLGGALDVPALERALGEVVRRHEALRTVFADAGGSPVQVIAPFAGFHLPVEDLSVLDGAARDEAVRRRTAEEAGRPFDLAAGPLFRATLLRVAEDDHVLLLAMHHVVSDGWSMDVLSREAVVLYGAFRQGAPSPLPELPVQYADYAVWQRRQLQGPMLEAQLGYWRDRLAGAPEVLELPADRPRPAARSFRGARVPIAFPLALQEGLRGLAREEGATLFMVLLAGWQTLLARYGGTDDVVVGTPVAGRGRGETEGLIGFFVNNLVLRTDLGGDPSFRHAVRRARETTLGAFEHQELPFEKLVAELQPERSLNRSPFFQVVFTLQSAGRPGADASAAPLDGLRVIGGEAPLDTIKFDLTLTCVETPQGVRGALSYATDLFDRPTAARMVDHLRLLLEQAVADADAPVSTLQLLAGAERAQVLDAWNDTEAPFPDDVCLHALIEAQVRQNPHAQAVSAEGTTLTYGELDRAANRLAHALRARGVGPETRVALHLDPSAEMIVALLAVLKAGGAYVPLDTGSPADRLAWMLEDSGARLVLAGPAGTDALPADGPPVLRAGEVDLAGFPETRPETGAVARNLAYVIYTSGSTGRPKGVGVEHRGVCNSATAYIRIYGIRPGSRVLLFAPLHFDASVLDVFTTLCSGATLVVASRDAMTPGPGLVELLREERVTHLKITPSALAVTPAAELPALESVMSGGESCSAELVARWAPGRRFFNGYGATEHSVRCTFHRCEPGPLPPPVGRPIANARLYVLDPALNPVPAGVAGEVYMAGVGVTRGYLNRAALSAERFLPDPFWGVPGARMYRSGDRGRWTADGSLEFVGRVDFQLKVRGFRVEPGEVEAALLEHPALVDAVVVARGSAAEDRALAAYVVAGEGAAAPGSSALRAFLRERLPEYMVPNTVTVLDRLPLTPNGKVDRRALPDPEAEGEAYTAPRTPAEAALAEIWAQLLGRERVGVHDDFFGLGGHSLLAVRMVFRVREAFGPEVPLRALYEHPTLAGFARAVEGAAAQAAAPAPIVAAARAETVLAGVDDLTEDELDRLLAGLSAEEMEEEQGS